MSRFVFKLPDLGEGTVEAEIVAWRVKPGDSVAEDDIVADVMTEKAVVELPAPVSGRVVSVTGAPGDKLPVGSELIVIEMDADVQTAEESVPTLVAAAAEPSAPQNPAAGGSVSRAANGANGHHNGAYESQDDEEGVSYEYTPNELASAANAKATAAAAISSNESVPSHEIAEAHESAEPHESVEPNESAEPNERAAAHAHGNSGRASRVATSPAVRRRAREAGVDLTSVPGSGPHGRIMRKDFEEFMQGHDTPISARSRSKHALADAVEEIKVIGLRRVIAQRMTDSKRNIPHFSYVEEVDVTELEALRRHLNSKHPKGAPTLTYLPFLVAALTRVLKEFPQCNAHYDSDRGVLLRHSSVHVGVATQTPDGLKVPVLKNAQTKSLWEIAGEIRRVSEAARTNKATRDELSGSTITVTSLGKLGGIASTPIINAPEMAIIGVNRAVERPMVYAGAITIRRMMNLSSSFDHRFVDGHDAAALIQELKERLEHPATIFIDR